MQQLILKEFFLQKKMFPFYFFIPILSVFKNSVEPMGIAIGLFITCSTIIYISFYYDEKSKAEKVLVSLDRKSTRLNSSREARSRMPSSA